MDEFEINMENIQQNFNSNIIINNEDIDIELNVLPFAFYHDETPKIKYYNNGNKIICPKYILFELSKYENIVYPITIKYKNIYLGIYEFKEFIDEIYIPNTIFYNLDLIENEKIKLQILHKPLPKATYIKIKPHCENFNKIEVKKKYLEPHLKNLYTVLSENTTITLIYGNDTLSLSILECKPEPNVSIDDIDELEIDVEPLVKPKPKIISSLKEEKDKVEDNVEDKVEDNDKTFKPFSGKGHTLGSSSDK